MKHTTLVGDAAPPTRVVFCRCSMASAGLWKNTHAVRSFFLGFVVDWFKVYKPDSILTQASESRHQHFTLNLHLYSRLEIAIHH